MWKPEVGEYVVSKRTNKLYLIGEIDIEHKRFMLPKLLSWNNFDDFRPAVLSDFAVEIEGYGKVWYVEGANGYIARYTFEDGVWSWYGSLAAKTDPFDMWEKKAIIAHYNITVLPEKLWTKLSEAKDE